MRALAEVLGVEPQPEELLLEVVGAMIVEAPWGKRVPRCRVVRERTAKGSRRGGTIEGQGSGKWSMPGFSVGPGGAVMVAGNYVVEAVQTQVILQAVAGRRV